LKKIQSTGMNEREKRWMDPVRKRERERERKIYRKRERANWSEPARLFLYLTDPLAVALPRAQPAVC
jgi:hypothetical protein